MCNDKASFLYFISYSIFSIKYVYITNDNNLRGSYVWDVYCVYLCTIRLQVWRTSLFKIIKIFSFFHFTIAVIKKWPSDFAKEVKVTHLQVTARSYMVEYANVFNYLHIWLHNQTKFNQRSVNVSLVIVQKPIYKNVTVTLKNISISLNTILS